MLCWPARKRTGQRRRWAELASWAPEKGCHSTRGVSCGHRWPSCRKGHRGAVVDGGRTCSWILKRRTLQAAGRVGAAAGVEGEGAILGGSAGRLTPSR